MNVLSGKGLLASKPISIVSEGGSDKAHVCNIKWYRATSHTLESDGRWETDYEAAVAGFFRRQPLRRALLANLPWPRGPLRNLLRNGVLRSLESRTSRQE